MALLSRQDPGPAVALHSTSLFFRLSRQVLLFLLVATPWPAGAERVERLATNPIIRPEMLPGEDGRNINGPSLVLAPRWAGKPLGRYYLYFAHHSGGYIRLAYADKLSGPWRIHAGGVLALADVPGCRDHIASPDVVVLEPEREVRMYFHCPPRYGRGQRTFVALSRDGLAFAPRDAVLGPPYFRVFRHDGWWYALAKGGALLRSRDGLHSFERGPDPFQAGGSGGASGARPRHLAVALDGTRLSIYYSRIGDTPERILGTDLDLTGDWLDWQVSSPREVLRPEKPWEGAALPMVASRAGESVGPENALRDPAVFVDTDGRRYLLYSVAGESGIGISELKR